MTTKEQFIEMAKGITRPGIDQMMAWLETTDFYTGWGRSAVQGWRVRQAACTVQAGRSKY